MMEMSDIFGPGGLLSTEISAYEHRTEQLHMAEFILERLYDGGNGLVEAGTGTGKTLAYLFPAILFALEEDRKIAISTETKALQKQLVGRDLPLVQRILQRCGIENLSFSLCLGGGNYPCRMRLESALRSGKCTKGEINKLKRVISLFNREEIFTSFDLNLPSHLWGEINRVGDSCNSFRCTFSSACPYQLARREWARSTLLVMNHHLFFSNISSGKSYLPSFDIVIFDEAHSLEEIASSQLGFSLGRRELSEIISLFYTDSRGSITAGISDEGLRDRCVTCARGIGPMADIFFESLRGLVPGEKSHVRFREPPAGGESLVMRLKEFMVMIADVGKGIGDDHPMRIDFDIASGKLFTYIENLASFVFHQSENHVYWLEKESGALLGELFLRGQPVEVAETMSREIIGCYDSTMFVSATLAVDGDFSYVIDRLGIENQRAVAIPSSFDFQSQVVLYAARDMADPGDADYHRQASDRAAAIINELGGNCLILFTSYRSLREVRCFLSGMVAQTIYSQDEMSAMEAFDRYVEDDNAVLMGTHSYWQGIDLPGDLVRGVIMMKLPFAVPDSPPVEAKMERLQAAGKNPFYALQVPEAIIRFKQGFGRLIRGSGDRGIVAILDSRILSKPYGRLFLKSIPQSRVVHSVDELRGAYLSLGAI